MAQVSISLLNFLNNDEEDDVTVHRNGVIIEDLDWAPDFEVYNNTTAPDLFDFSQTRPGSEPGQMDLLDRERQLNFVMDMFQQRVEQTQSSTREYEVGFEENEVVDLSGLDLDFGLGLGFCGAHDEDDDVDPDQLVSGLRVVDIGSDSDPDESSSILESRLFNVDEAADVEDSNIGLCWDSFCLEANEDEDFEWEEIDDSRELINMFLEETEGITITENENAPHVDRTIELENLEWEFLLNVHSLEGNVVEFHNDHDDSSYTAEYELLFEQFAENENSFVGRPPASKTVVKDLPIVVLSEEDLEKDNATTCAICKDEMSLGEKVRELPCAHRYHGECILPWLGIRNTCPVCRHELPTDDPEYERRRRVQTRSVG